MSEVCSQPQADSVWVPLNRSSFLFFRYGRECNEACTINGIQFPRGMLVIVPAYALHRDPEYWPDPEKFEPER